MRSTNLLLALIFIALCVLAMRGTGAPPALIDNHAASAPVRRAGYQLCKQIGPDADDGDDEDAPDGTPDSRMWRQEPDPLPHAPDGQNLT